MSKFINPAQVLAQLELPAGACVADLGCGSGYYTLAAAKMVGSEGQVYAVDILQDKLAATQSTAQHEGFKNVIVVHADLERPLENVPALACDMVVMSNIVHLVRSPEVLLKNAYRILKSAGYLLVVEWKREHSPFGPLQSSRIPRETLISLAEQCGFRYNKDLQADGYHYAALFTK